MSEIDPQIRYYAPGISDPEEFRSVVESHTYFLEGHHQDADGIRIISNRLGWIQESLAHGRDALEGTDMLNMSEAQLMTEVAVLKDLLARGLLEVHPHE